MKLNKAKCEALVFGGTAKVKFKDDTPVRTVEQAKYLGCQLNKTHDTYREVKARIKEATIILNKLHIFWLHSNCTTRFKLTVLQAASTPKCYTD